jgi:hypothetical protein
LTFYFINGTIKRKKEVMMNNNLVENISKNVLYKEFVQKDFANWPKPRKVVYSFPYTTVYFNDGSQITVKCHNEAYDYEKGLAMAIAKRVMTRADFDRLVESGKSIFEEKMENFRASNRRK